VSGISSDVSGSESAAAAPAAPPEGGAGRVGGMLDGDEEVEKAQKMAGDWTTYYLRIDTITTELVNRNTK